MQVPHDALILVADGQKMLLLRNEGNPLEPRFTVEENKTHENPRDREQKSDAAGGASSTQLAGGQFSPSRGTMEEADYHQLEEDRFAARIVASLNEKAASGALGTLIVVAPARMLGALRKHYGKELAGCIGGEIDKDLTGHPVPEIETVLSGA